MNWGERKEIKELKLSSNSPLQPKMNVSASDNEIIISTITIYHGTMIALDRNQVHLLKLFLEEFLK
jgi:hypothetical protein